MYEGHWQTKYTLQYLIIKRNDIKDKGFRFPRIFSALRHNPNFKNILLPEKINVACNNILKGLSVVFDYTTLS